MVDCLFTLGDCPGIGASAPFRVCGAWTILFTKLPFSQETWDFFQKCPDFSQETPDFSQTPLFFGESVGKSFSKIGVFYWLFVNILRFFIDFSLLSE